MKLIVLIPKDTHVSLPVNEEASFYTLSSIRYVEEEGYGSTKKFVESTQPVSFVLADPKSEIVALNDDLVDMRQKWLDALHQIIMLEKQLKDLNDPQTAIYEPQTAVYES